MLLRFHYLSSYEISRWKAWISFLTLEAPEEDSDTIPEVSVYPTMLHSLQDNTKTERTVNEATAERFYKKNVWAYAILIEGDTLKNGRKINLCINRINGEDRNIPIEFNFLHEIGHFNIMRRRLPRKVYFPQDEEEADMYGLVQYLKILKKYPAYTTMSVQPRAVKMEKTFREYLEVFQHNSIEEIAGRLSKELGWKK